MNNSLLAVVVIGPLLCKYYLPYLLFNFHALDHPTAIYTTYCFNTCYDYLWNTPYTMFTSIDRSILLPMGVISSPVLLLGVSRIEQNVIIMEYCTHSNFLIINSIQEEYFWIPERNDYFYCKINLMFSTRTISIFLIILVETVLTLFILRNLGLIIINWIYYRGR
jgi:hypothetical protein